MKNPIIGFCRVKDVVYNQFEREGDERDKPCIYGGVDKVPLTDQELRKQHAAQTRFEEQYSYYVMYEKVKPFFGNIVPLSYDGNEYRIHPEGLYSASDAPYEGIKIPLQWVEILTVEDAFGLSFDEMDWESLLYSPGIMFRSSEAIEISISKLSICGVHYIDRSDSEGYVYDGGFITKGDLREIYNNIGTILGAKK